jgi:23S rRNA pseudouridine1911/1915/1917 synthase
MYYYLTKETGCINLSVNVMYVRIDKYLSTIFTGLLSRSKIQKLILYGYVKVNYFIIFNKKLIVRKNDVIQIITPIKEYDNSYELLPVKIQLNIIYEDADILILNKPSGLVVHPGNGNTNNTLLNGVKYYFDYKKIKISSDNKEFHNRLGLVHRLDKNTSGLILLAKNYSSYIFLKNQFIHRKVKKKYLAIIWGVLHRSKGIINDNIGRSFSNRLKMQTFIRHTYGKTAITKYVVLLNLLYFSFIKCDLYTGRTHQIRIHLKSLGHPIFNDCLYGGNKILFNKSFLRKKINYFFRLLPVNRHCLHACYLEFIHPTSNKTMIFKSKLPKDILSVLLELKKMIYEK